MPTRFGYENHADLGAGSGTRYAIDEEASPLYAPWRPGSELSGHTTLRA